MAALTVDEAFAHCESRVRSHYENFPVGLFVPKDKRRYVHALYAFARAADDFADEPMYEGMRKEKLDQWEARLDAAYAGQAEDPIFVALAETVRRLDIPKQLLADLLSAFRQDTVKSRYENWDELADYCRRSANPVGRLVLLVFGYKDPDLPALSDAICTGLQLANHWQDVAVDLEKDRIYLPQDSWRRFGVTEKDLVARAASSDFKRMMAFEVERAREFFMKGRSLPERVEGRLRWELRFTWHGGVRILDKIEKADYDVFKQRPVLTKADWLGIAIRTLFSHG